MDQQHHHRTIIRRQDYSSPVFLIDKTVLEIDLDADRTVVTATLDVKRFGSDTDGPLVLDGVDLELLGVEVNGQALTADEYQVTEQSLSIPGLGAEAVLRILVASSPARNTALEGLYQSGRFLLTQCEAEGFRKIVYYLDRPDVMSPFTVTLRGDKSRYPVLLSNGNPIDRGELEGGRHFVTWEDPFPKPSYLFALVAGDLAWLEDRHTTKSGRDVTLRIYAEQENVERCRHAMDSLIKSMRWDEETYGLEYDLDIFNIVVTNDFNMGAMENKSLNIFNAKFVLADPETATDWDYQAIEGVIGHEYFHNWTGNRVTCRDWFQLTLKEGLTVFRDQEFSADMQGRAVKRIHDVRDLRRRQFPEDAGPMAHPVRPDQYLEISNFYTATVYQKGGEVVRMYQTLLGPAGFKKGLKLYLERHDGQAVTCDDFLNAMSDANQRDLTQFGRWYSQSGTPVVKVEMDFNEDEQKCTLTFAQSIPGQPDAEPLMIPLAMGLLNYAGQPQPLQLEGDDQAQVATHVLVLTQKTQSFTFVNVPVKPLPSLLRGYSAPVKIEYDWEREDLARLMQEDMDPFCRWDASETMYLDTLLSLTDAMLTPRLSPVADPLVVKTFHKILQDTDLTPAFAAELLTLPSETYLCEQMKSVSVEGVHRSLRFLRRSLAMSLHEPLRQRYHSLIDEEWSQDAEASGRRRLKNLCLELLCTNRMEADFALAEAQYDHANCMTDRLAALIALVHEQAPGATARLSDFAERYSDNPLVMDKWFTIQATRPHVDAIEQVLDLMEHAAYSRRNPNKVRALLGAFAMMNPMGFHTPDGTGYALIAEEVLALDRMNPQTAARLALSFNRWRHMDEHRSAIMRGQLERILQAPQLSPDVYEVVSHALKEPAYQEPELDDSSTANGGVPDLS